ncbi:hypothetical protein [Microvirga massiliensis]|uniref:hypothetical protein n=1 Tax=Microvirga massiliensis TaxID=1033741 RepID=UPI00062B7F74|nr:hypothetical protein [Microvirga massiliensis]
MLKLWVIALWAMVLSGSAQAADKIEAVGGEKCGSPAAPYTVEFLAPEDAQVEAEARAKASDETPADRARDTAALSLDGKPCADARCSFRALKGKTYTLVAENTRPRVRQVCISVARP